MKRKRKPKTMKKIFDEALAQMGWTPTDECVANLEAIRSPEPFRDPAYGRPKDPEERKIYREIIRELKSLRPPRQANP